MRVVPVLGVLSGPEGDCPPLPFLEIDDAEAGSLIARGLAVAFDPADIVAEPEPEPIIEPVVEPVIDPVIAPADDAATRAQSIRDAIELLDADGFEAKGDRKGKPTVEAVQTVLGDEHPGITAEEIDAAIAEPAAE